MKKLWLFVTLCFYTVLAVSQSQSFPVQVIPQAIPPAPILFSDYADNTTINSPLRVQIILNDFTISNREIHLRTYFEGNGITFQSNNNVSGAPSLFLEGGIPTILTNVELAPYFRFENITGISPNVYGQTIPEGVYQFCFEVFDVLTGRRLSDRSCVTTVIFKNEPPFLVSPLDKTNIQERNPQNIVFQWTPRHINVTNVEYELSIVEIWDNYVDPQTAFLSSPPVFQTTTTATTYVYGPADPLFLSNKKYAWRVQAKAKRGTEEIGLFKNQGYSEIFSFSYATPCDKPVSVAHETKGAHQVNISWEDFTTEIPKFKIRYRKQGDNGEWFYSQTSANWITLWDLRSKTTYEFQISKLCAVSESDWTSVDTFTTGNQQDETALYNCGIPPDINLENQNPLPSIEKGESFKAGDFDIKILEVSGAEGRFTGEGYVTIPYLKNIKVGVKFTNILINTDKQLSEGMVITTYNIDAGNIVDVDEVIDTVSDVVEGVGEIFEGDNDLDEININFDIDEDDIEIVDDRIVITNPDTGDRFDYPMGDDTVITDASGDVYYVDEEGNVTKGGQKDPGGIVNSNNVDGVSNSGELESLTAKGLVVYFKGANKLGFDQVPDSQKDKLTDHYLTIKDEAGKDYTLIHQAVKKGDSTTVIAEVKQQGSAYELKDIIFKTKQGEKLNTKIIGDKIEVTVKGHYSFENETIYAVVPSKTEEKKQLTAGAFTLWHLTERVVDMVLVPVNGASLRANEAKQVADIFKKGAAKLNIKVGDPFNFDKNRLGANGLDVGESPWLTAYNEEQKSVMAAFKQDPKSNYNKSTYYVFVFNDITPSRNIAGFMPLQRQYGFVFDSSITAPEEGKGDLTKTIAHEIGHGVFALQHPFTNLKTDEGQTSWLMDYSAGSDDHLLSHMDWAQIHNPDLKFYIFQDEEDGELAGEVWFTPDWKPIEVKRSSIIVSSSKSAKIKGTLPGFRVDNIKYKALFDTSGGFSGYYEDGKTTGKKYQISPIKEEELKDKVYLFVRGDGTCNKVYSADYSYVIQNKISIDFNESNTNINYDPDRIKCEELCEQGEEFVKRHANKSQEIKEVVIEIAKLMCQEDIDASLLVDFNNSAYQNLYEWQKQFFNEDVWSDELWAYEAFEKGFTRYINLYKNNKETIKNIDLVDRKKILGTTYSFTNAQLKLLTAAEKLSMLNVLVDGHVGGYFTGNYNTESLVLSIVNAVNDDKESDQTKLFLEGLVDKQYKVGDKYLYENLFNKIDDYMGEANFTELLIRFTKLALDTSPDTKSKLVLDWGARNESFVLNYVVSGNDYEFEIEGENVLVTGECLEKKYEISRNGERIERGCKRYKYDNLPLHPFNDFVTLTILENTNILPSFMCGTPNAQWCGKAIKVPSVFLPYLQEKKRTQSFENWGINTVVVAGTVLSFGEVAAARAAGQVAYWAIADLTYTFSGPAVQVLYDNFDDKSDTEEFKDYFKSGWDGIGYVFLAKSAADVTGFSKEKLAKGYAAIKTYGEDDFYQIFEQSLREASTEMAEEQIKAISRDIRKTVNQVGDELPKNLRDQELEIAQKLKSGSVGNFKDLLRKKLLGKLGNDTKLANLKSWINDLQDGQVLNKLEELGDKVDADGISDLQKLGNDFDKLTNTGISFNDLELLSAWGTLSRSPIIRAKPENLKILKQVHQRFEYEGKTSFDGLNQLLNEGSTASRQNLINGLDKVDKIFDADLPVKFSGIKKGEVKVNTIDGTGDEVARYVDNVVVKKKFLDQGTPKGKYDGSEILQKGDEVGFRATNVENKWASRALNTSSDAKLINRIKELRQKLTSRYKKSGNFGHAEVEISGVSKKEYYAHSSIDELKGELPNRVPDISLKPKTEDEIFPWTTELNKSGDLVDRNIDTEYKILTEIAQKLGDNTNANGSIKLFTERLPCKSCSNLISLFKEKYPKIDIEVIHNQNNPLINF